MSANVQAKWKDVEKPVVGTQCYLQIVFSVWFAVSQYYSVVLPLVLVLLSVDLNTLQR